MGTALVTGATAGLGREFCWQLAEARHDLVLVARDRERLDDFAEQLRQVAAVNVEVLPADLAEPDQLAKVCVRLARGRKEGLPPVGLLVNNAGFGLGGKFLDNDLDYELYGLEVMVRAIMATCHFAGRAMRERGHGAIINVSSVAAGTGMGSYSAHKAWVRAFSEGLAMELSGSGVTVTAVSPGLVHTEFHERAGMDTAAAPDILWSDAQAVVDEALTAMRRGDVLVTPTPLYKALNGVNRVAPRWLVRNVVSRFPHT